MRTRAGELDATTFRKRLDEIANSHFVASGAPVMVSGGEPTEHPDFMRLVSAPEFMRIEHRFVISSGHAFADRGFALAFHERSPNTQIYLQYDSPEPDHVRFIRGHDFTQVHERAIANCEELGIPYTLVCVILRNVNDHLAADMIAQGLSRKHCVGVTLQPVKSVGRTNGTVEEHLTNVFDLVAKLQLGVARAGVDLQPHPANPLNWAIGYADRSPHVGVALYNPGRRKRAAVIWHTDPGNFVLESVARHPITFAMPEGLVPLEVRYGAI